MPVLDELECRRQQQRSAAEHAVWRILASADGIEAASAQILEAVCRCAGWELGELWMVEAAAGVLRLEALWHQYPDRLSEFIAVSRATTFVPRVGLPGRVWASREPAWVEDVVRDPNFPRAPVAASAGLHAAFGFPVRAQGTVLGVMCFYSPEFRAPDPDLLESLDIIGEQIGQFVLRVRGQAALRASETRLRALFEQLDQAVIILLDGRTIDCNPAAVRLFGLSAREQMLGAAPSDFSPARQPDGEESPAAAARLIQRALGGESLVFEWRNLRPDGTSFDVDARLSSIHLGDRQLLQCILTDVTVKKRVERELQAALEEVRALTLRDPLTGAYNRRYLETALAIELSAARRHGLPLCLAMVDVDHFKAVNDRHGHSAGDTVLQALTRALAGELRAEDLLARYGGEEFVLVMRNTAYADGVALVERGRSLVERMQVPAGGVPLQVTLSCGVASLADCGEPTSEALLGAADARLYAAKAQGRNRVVGAT